jgi:hypothetical protein
MVLHHILTGWLTPARAHPARFCRFLLLGMVLVLVPLAAIKWSMRGAAEAGKLALEFVGYTKDAPYPSNAMLRFENRSSDPMLVMRGVTIEFPAGRGQRAWQEIDATNFLLSPNENRVLYFSAPTNGSVWRAEAAFIGQSQIDKKVYLAEKLKPWPWLRRRMARNLELNPEHACIRWIDPLTGGLPR